MQNTHATGLPIVQGTDDRVLVTGFSVKHSVAQLNL